MERTSGEPSATRNSLGSFHRTLGLATLVVFLATGAYMKFVAHPERLPDGGHLMFLSRHIYILANALVNLAIGAYVVSRSNRRARATQRIGSSLLALSALLLVAAFVVESVGGRARTPLSSFGLYTLFAGTLLHFLAARSNAGTAAN